MPSTEEIMALLKERGLRDTLPRRHVLDACHALRKPVSPQDVFHWLQKRDRTIDLVTIYRILSRFESLGLAHRHACNGNLALCTMPHKEGHHGFLHCTHCGVTREFISSTLCQAEEAIARKAKFSPQHHVSEIVGMCAPCSHSRS